MVPEITPGPEVPASRAIRRLPALRRTELNLPNLITLARLLSVPLAIWLIFDGRYGAGIHDIAACDYVPKPDPVRVCHSVGRLM